LIFRDPIAVDLVPEAPEQSIRTSIDEITKLQFIPLYQALPAFRSRFSEERLARAVRITVCISMLFSVRVSVRFAGVGPPLPKALKLDWLAGRSRKNTGLRERRRCTESEFWLAFASQPFASLRSLGIS
jgi:hypothetical protein